MTPHLSWRISDRYSRRYRDSGLSPFPLECAKQGKAGRFEVLSIQRGQPPQLKHQEHHGQPRLHHLDDRLHPRPREADFIAAQNINAARGPYTQSHLNSPSVKDSMEFHILGPLEVRRDNEPIGLGGPRQRAVLAMLLLEADQVVPVDRLINAVWDHDPPLTAREQVHICISSLRHSIGNELISTCKPGYLLRLDGCTLDSRIFDAQVQEGREALSAADAAGAVASLRSALSLWRGKALSSVSSALVQRCVIHLNERRLSVLEECIEIELKAGLGQDLVSELIALSHENPLHERFSALLMMALYQAGRQAEALETYRNMRTALSDELGIEPGLELQQLHQVMLAGEPVAEIAGQAMWVGDRRATGQVDHAPAPILKQPPQSAIPMLLPATIPDFTGRANLIDKIIADTIKAGGVEQALPITVFHGPGGVGKTTLALYLAHRLAARFPDGQLFAELQFGSQPVDVSDILKRFLRALGVSNNALPQDREELVEMYRNLLARRRILVVLDNVVSEEQIKPLLPGNAQCMVLVTSRRVLTGLPAGNRIEIGPFGRHSSVAMLSRIVGAERIEAEPDATSMLCELCGNLPLALRIAAARLAARPHWSVAALVHRLVDESRQLDELNFGGTGMRASITLSYDALSPEARRLFRLLALFEVPHFSSWVGSSLLQIDPLRAEDLFEELTEAHMLSVEPAATTESARYRFHDIMRPFARERLLEFESPDERRTMLKRLIEALLFLASEAYRRQYSGDYMLIPGSVSCWELPAAYTNSVLENPLSWYEQERFSILAGVRQAAACGLISHSWRLALSAVPLFEAHSRFSDWHITHETALKAACGFGDQHGEAAMRYSLGSLFMIEREYHVAARQFNLACKLFEQLGDKYSTALVLRYIAFLDRQGGNLDLALARWEESLGTFQVLGDSIAEAYVLHNIAQVRIDYGEYEEALRLLGRASRICAEAGNLRVGAQVRHRLGTLHLQRDEFDLATDMYTRTLAAVRQSDDLIGQCSALLGLAAVDIRRDEPQRARQHLAEARELAAVAGDPTIDSQTTLTLAEAELAVGEFEAAAEHADKALREFEEQGMALFHVRSLIIRGHIYRALSSPHLAMTVWKTAAQLLSRLKLRQTSTLCEEVNALIADIE